MVVVQHDTEKVFCLLQSHHAPWIAGLHGHSSVVLPEMENNLVQVVVTVLQPFTKFPGRHKGSLSLGIEIVSNRSERLFLGTSRYITLNPKPGTLNSTHISEVGKDGSGSRGAEASGISVVQLRFWD